MVISSDDKKTLEILLNLAEHELQTDHRYLDAFEAEMA